MPDRGSGVGIEKNGRRGSRRRRKRKRIRLRIMRMGRVEAGRDGRKVKSGGDEEGGG